MSEPLRQANRKLTRQLWVFAAGSLAFAFALVPLYDVLCSVTGFGDRKALTKAADVQNIAAADRDVTIEFIATNPTVGEWRLQPAAHSLVVRAGRLAEMKFIATNLLAKPAVAQAVPSIAPREVAEHFRKTECFCFTPQSFKAHETRELTVRFVVDPRLPANVDRLTLGYALYGATEMVAAN